MRTMLETLKGYFFGPQRGRALWGNTVIPHKFTNYPFVAMGQAGSGKSWLIRRLQQSVLPDVKHEKFDTRFLIYDAKNELFGDIALLGLQEHTAILNPFDVDCSPWDIYQDVKTEADAREAAAVIVPPRKAAASTDNFFVEAARLIISKTIVALMRNARLKKIRPWNFRDVILAVSNTEDLEHFVGKAELSDLEAIAKFLTKEREAQSVQMSVKVEEDPFRQIAAIWHHAQHTRKNPMFSMNEWVKGKGRQILLLGASKKYRESVASINRVLIQGLQARLFDVPENDANTGRRSWFFLDEFPAIGGIPKIEELITEGRSRGICAVLGFQHIQSITNLYRELTDVVVGQCLHQAYFYTGSPSMADWCSKHFALIISAQNPNEPHENAHSSPAATINTFMKELRPASKDFGFECIIKTINELEDGPYFMHLRPKEAFWNVPKEAIGSKRMRTWIPWELTEFQEIENLQAWSELERRDLNLPPKENKRKRLKLLEW